VLTPMNRSELGARNLNTRLQAVFNPPPPHPTLSPAGGGEGRVRGRPEVQRFGWTFRVGDKGLQTGNDYQKGGVNGAIGRVAAIDEGQHELTVAFEGRQVVYDFGELGELALAFAMSVHRSQGSEYPAVVIPLHSQHYLMLQRNLLYTGITRGKKLVVLV